MKDCYGIVYKFTNKTTGKWYIGSHNNSNKDYCGSGIMWTKAVKKHGIEKFTKEILYEGENCREMEELVLMTVDAKNDPMSYNLKNESVGGAFHGEANGMFGKKLTEEQKYKCGSAFRGKKRPDHSKKMIGDKNPMFGRNDQVAAAVAKSKTNTGKTIEEIYGNEVASVIKRKLSKAHKGKPKPDVSVRQSGSGNSSAKRIIIDDVEYGCIKDAMKALNMSRYKIKQICTEV